MKEIFEQLRQGLDLSSKLATNGFELILSGEASQPAIGAFLGMLAQKGEAVAEITAGMQVMNAKAKKLIAPKGAMDIVGSGGDGLHSYNVSTNAAFIAAACGIPIAKHGSRAVSSQSGASDVLTALGINIHASQETMQKSLDNMGIAFMFAQAYHQAVANVMPARQAIGIRTIFNFLGPICNPADVKNILLGISERRLLEPFAEVLKNASYQRFMVVIAENNMDEMSLSSPTYVMRYDGKNLEKMTLTPEDAGLEFCTQEALTGGDAAHNAAAIKAVLQGNVPSELEACRDLVLFNSAAALWVGGKADNLKDGVALSREAIASGAALKKLNDFIKATN